MSNLIMMDFAWQDPKSVSAMIRGHGDGRERHWHRFVRKHPDMEMEDLMVLYHRKCANEPAPAFLHMAKALLWAIGVFLVVV